MKITKHIISELAGWLNEIIETTINAKESKNSKKNMEL